ncbi:MAG: hypothetical protein ACRED5_07730 [Propylenella sp.]
MARADSILSRFPAHFEALKPGKVLRNVVGALARDLDVQAAELAAIRRSHRLFEADQLSDLILIAARHGVSAASLEILTMRFERARALLKELREAGDTAARDEAAAALLALWGIEGEEPKLALFADANEDGSPIDLTGEAGDAAAERLIAAATAAVDRKARNDAARTRIATTIRIAANGNGTVRALLSGAANALDLDIGPIKSSDDRYLHASFAFDRLRLKAEGKDGPIAPAAAREVIGLEENPLYRVETDAVPRKHTELFDQLRRGFERATLQIRVTGEGERTIGPMVVNRDEGHGVGYAGKVPGAERLTFEEGGRVKLGPDDVTPFAFAWKGACFADAATPHANDYVFTEDDAENTRGAAFAVSFPDGALDPDFVFPHAGDSLPMPGVSVGRTRFAFFVQEAHASLGPTSASPAGRRVPPRLAVGFLDGSVFAPGPDETRTPLALVSFSWLERRAHAVRILIPPRFRTFDTKPEAPDVRRRLVEAAGRFKPAGIFLEAEFLDDRWTLGEGAMTAAAADDPVAALSGGTVLWSAPDQGGT